MLDRALHENIMTRILVDIYSESALRQKLGFKGGTAAYLFYNLPRFSTDLDFDYLDSDNHQKVNKIIKSICSKYGEIKDEQIKENTIYFRISYKAGIHNIKIEISKRTNSGNTYNIREYFGLPVLVMDRDCLAANKLVATLDRKKMVNRDWFDSWFLLDQHWPINEKVIERRTGLKLPDYLQKMADYLERNKSKMNILEGLGEVLDTKQKNYVKNKMVNDLIIRLKLYSGKPEILDTI
ncbi:MAG: nucleotidyl transferase AbiEii/AbiGii toxin family protein [Candidatus Berkelbacteria bacterium]|nr:nucleotidyl transferase AbiEii/AbiGii toxin family protein [Candidatus Berkelbacteria bacterium]